MSRTCGEGENVQHRHERGWWLQGTHVSADSSPLLILVVRAYFAGLALWRIVTISAFCRVKVREGCGCMVKLVILVSLR